MRRWKLTGIAFALMIFWIWALTHGLPGSASHAMQKAGPFAGIV
ncbi:hypothetical protein [Roseateles saccharophilus]|uniref:Uncharacterized protein n=1 Tax=Roseateles saccharophilus TaxID=304 RepID=A0A4R3VB21_ROSSA|nr:hypothetical protein [Roseateles saccharophilus]TCV02446.1 hypothetical protein EV671_1004221 [Roseateles saccharophilus]